MNIRVVTGYVTGYQAGMSSAERVRKHRERAQGDGRRRVELRTIGDAAAAALKVVNADMTAGRLSPNDLLDLSSRKRAAGEDLSWIQTVADFRRWLEREDLLVERDDDWPPQRDRTPYLPTDPFE